MAGRYERQFNITYDYLVSARVTAVHPVSKTRRLHIDAAALDGRGAWSSIPIALPEGFSRNYRRGQIVALAFRFGSAQFPIAVGHFPNTEDPASGFGDPLPTQHENVDDQVFYHAETGAFIRFRNTASTAGTGGGDGKPVLLEITSSSGHTVVLDETPGAEKITAKSAAGHAFTMDDVKKAISHVSIGGHKVDIDDIAGQIKMLTATGEQHVLDSVKGQVSTIAKRIGLGKYADQLADDLGAVVKHEMDSFVSALNLQRKLDALYFAQAMVSGGVAGAQGYLTYLLGTVFGGQGLAVPTSFNDLVGPIGTAITKIS